METERHILKNMSPWDHRYSLRQEEFDSLARFFSEEAQILYQARVEEALVAELAEIGICPQWGVQEVRKAVQTLQPIDVYEEEQKTHHNIRALVNVLGRQVSKEIQPFLHLTATSMDIVDTANMMRYRDAHQECIMPVLDRVMCHWIRLARQEVDTLQVGRTHGQHAVPITFGFALAQHLQRLGWCRDQMETRAKELRGKMAGAVGAYNASGMIMDHPQAFEKAVLKRLGLKASPISTQVVAPEYLLDYLHSCVMALGVLADFSDDMRHLQRTEISEVGEFFSQEQVGSSTMPQKRNPINYEHIKSLWKAVQPRIQTCYMDQLTEHQRDLTNSASARFYSDIPIALFLSLQRLERVLQKFSVDQQAMEKNVATQGDMILAEPLYILLASQGHSEAHEAVRSLTLKAQKQGMGLLDALKHDQELLPYWETMKDWQKDILVNPRRYTGQAREKAESICQYWEKRMKQQGGVEC